MKTPFPGMDPYLEHPILWEGVHAQLIARIADQLQPLLDPRYVATVEERVFVEGPQRRIPDVRIDRVEESSGGAAVAVAPQLDTAVTLEVEELEIRETRVEILDSYNELQVVAVIEALSPTNKALGPGRESYLAKQAEVLDRQCHLVEIDVLREGRHAVAVPEWRILKEGLVYNYLMCICRFPYRNRYTVYPARLRDKLPSIRIPLVAPDPDVTLDVQAAFEHVYEMGRYPKRVRYHEPCVPPLSAEDQMWANEKWTAYRSAHSELTFLGGPVVQESNGP